MLQRIKQQNIDNLEQQLEDLIYLLERNDLSTQDHDYYCSRFIKLNCEYRNLTGNSFDIHDHDLFT